MEDIESPRKKLMNFDIYEDELCSQFIHLEPHFKEFVSKNTRNLNDIDQDGRTILHHIYLKGCYKITSWFLPSFDEQLKILTNVNVVNIFARDNYDKFAFEYMDEDFIESINYSPAKLGEKFYPIIELEGMVYREEGCPSLFYTPRLFSNPCLFSSYYRNWYENAVIPQSFYLFKLNEFMPGREVHGYSGGNLLHKLAAAPEIKLQYIHTIHCVGQIIPIIRLPNEAYHLPDKMSLEAALAKHLLSHTNIDIYLLNYKQLQPIDVATNNGVKAVLYAKFKEDFLLGKNINNPYPFWKYGITELLDKELIAMLRQSTYSLCEQRHYFDGNSALQLILTATNIKSASFDFMGNILDIAQSCRSSLYLPNYEGESAKEQMHRLFKSVCTPIKLQINEPVCLSYKVLIELPRPMVGYYNEDEVKKDYEARLMGLEQKLEKAYTDLEKLKHEVPLQFTNCIDQNKLGMLKAFLNSKEWLAHLKASLEKQNALLLPPSPLVPQLDEVEATTLNYLVDKIRGAASSIVEFLWHKGYSEANLPSSQKGKQAEKPILAYSKRMGDVESTLLNVQKAMDDALFKLVQGPEQCAEHRVKLDALLQVLNIPEWGRKGFIKLKEIDQAINNHYFTDNNQEKLTLANPIAPKQFEATYNAIKILYQKGEIHSQEAADILKALHTQCQHYHSFNAGGGLEFSFCLNAANYGFSQEWIFQ